MLTHYIYPIIIKKKIPFLTRGLEMLFGATLLVCFLAWLIYFPSTGSGNEMKTAALLATTPDRTLWIIAISAIAVMPSYLLYSRLRFNIKGFIQFEDDKIIFISTKKVITIPVAEIREIKFYQSGFIERPGKKVFVRIEQRNLETVVFKIKHFEHSDDITDSLLHYDSLANKIGDSDSFLK